MVSRNPSDVTCGEYWALLHAEMQKFGIFKIIAVIMFFKENTDKNTVCGGRFAFSGNLVWLNWLWEADVYLTVTTKVLEKCDCIRPLELGA